ncbi:serine/threonine protein kinase [Frigoriglobus tundricola]|uniref:serine/threonine protein kinase n=1 Tax=Frigoriglobus tundricola TaxID=2774151 RepID=UPI001D066E42|nr:serine/threonine-protein kinase [Frigoriglobus tundricola]
MFDFLFGKGKGKSGGSPKKGLKRVTVAKRFELSGRTGQGSMSKVYRAYDRELGRNVCLKLLDKAKTKKFEERFVGLKKPHEGEICMALRHDNIVRTYEHGITEQGEPYLVMEWVEGLGLNYLVETRAPQLKGNRINFMSQLCDAVQYMHSNKWLHRDICPRNVMVDKEGVLKLIDFGLTIPYTPQFCVPGNRTGTPDILAPEIISRKSTDHRVDLFALGVTGYEVFTGQLPWERSVSSEETFRRRLNSKPRTAKELNPQLDDPLSNLLLRSIAREPSERFPSATAFKEALAKLDKQDY